MNNSTSYEELNKTFDEAINKKPMDLKTIHQCVDLYIAKMKASGELQN
jgi:hypothetical protein